MHSIWSPIHCNTFYPPSLYHCRVSSQKKSNLLTTYLLMYFNIFCSTMRWRRILPWAPTWDSMSLFSHEWHPYIPPYPRPSINSSTSPPSSSGPNSSSKYCSQAISTDRSRLVMRDIQWCSQLNVMCDCDRQKKMFIKFIGWGTLFLSSKYLCCKLVTTIYFECKAAVWAEAEPELAEAYHHSSGFGFGKSLVNAWSRLQWKF